MLHYVTAIKNLSPCICLFFHFQDNLTCLSRNGLAWSKFKIFFFAIKNVVFIENHYFACFWSFWRSYEGKREKKNSSQETSQTPAQLKSTCLGITWKTRVKFEVHKIHLTSKEMEEDRLTLNRRCLLHTIFPLCPLKARFYVICPFSFASVKQGGPLDAPCVPFERIGTLRRSMFFGYFRNALREKKVSTVFL